MSDWDLPSLLAAAKECTERQLVMVGVPLGGSSRSVVFRVAPADAPSEPLLIKAFARDGLEGWCREVAALSTLGATGVAAPRLLGVSADHRLLVMTDLGGGPSLADSLLGRQSAQAGQHLQQWARAVGSLHAETRDRRSMFGEHLRTRGHHLALDTVPEMLRAAESRLSATLAELEVEFGQDARRELVDASMATEASALSPSDACPDNNIRIGNEVALIDFEGATFRHIAWDAAYLRVPWPTCWCSWRLEPAPAERALAVWRAAASAAFPAVSDRAFDVDLSAAQIRWSLISTGWFLPKAIDGDPADLLGADRVPARRAMITYRLTEILGIDSPVDVALTDLARRLLARLVQEWGHSHLDLAPAFRR